jgi:hypothetical protein
VRAPGALREPSARNAPQKLGTRCLRATRPFVAARALPALEYTRLDEWRAVAAMWRPMRLGFASILLVVLAGTGPARAQQANAQLAAALTVEPSADGCITAAALRPKIARWLRRSTPPAGLAVSVHGASEPLAFTLERDGQTIAERTFERLPARCKDRLDAMAIAIAIAIDPAVAELAAEPPEEGAAEATPGPEATQPEPEQPAAEQPPPTEPVPEAAPPELKPKTEPAAARIEEEEQVSTRPTWWLHAGGGVLLETLPEAAFVGEAGVEHAVGPLRLALDALVAPVTQVEVRPGSADLLLVGGRLTACMSLAAGELALDGCGGAAGGAVRASATGYDQSATPTMGWLSGLLRAALRFPTNGSFSGRLAVDGLIHVARPKLVVKQTGEEDPVDTAGSSVVGLAASLELLVALP